MVPLRAKTERSFVTSIKHLMRLPQKIEMPADEEPFRRHRREISAKYLRGRGIEVGALHSPLPIAEGVRIQYVDRMSVPDLRRQYPELGNLPLTPVDVIDDGEKLTKFRSGRRDFIIANHFLEHTQDPIGTLKAHLRVVRNRGILYMAVPNRHHTFDHERPPTSWEHVVRDHLHGPEWSYEEHLREWAIYIDKATGDTIEAKIKEMRDLNYSIHFHVWNDVEIRDFFERARRNCGIAIKMEHCENQGIETLCILRKVA